MKKIIFGSILLLGIIFCGESNTETEEQSAVESVNQEAILELESATEEVKAGIYD